MQNSKAQKPPGESFPNTAPRFNRQVSALAKVFNTALLLLSKQWVQISDVSFTCVYPKAEAMPL